MQKRILSAILVCILLLTSACTPGTTGKSMEPKTEVQAQASTEKDSANKEATPEEEKPKAGQEAMAEQAATPQTDFYSYINQKWLKESKIPEGEAAIDNFFETQKKTEARISQMIEDLRANYASLKEGGDDKKLIDLYNQALDFKSRNEQGIKPIQGYLDMVRNAKTREDLNKVLVALAQEDILTLFSFDILQDTKNSLVNALFIAQPSLGFSKKYFEDNDEYALKQQKAYKEYLKEIFTIIGDSPEVADKKAEQLYALEKDMAAAQLPQEEEQDFEKTYNVMTWEELKTLTPNLPFLEAAKGLKIDHAKKIIVIHPNSLAKANELYQEANLEAFKAQLEAKIITTFTSSLSKDLIEAKAKYDSAADGVYNLPTDEEQAFGVVDSIFSNILGKVYVEKNFLPTAKEDVVNMFRDIKARYIQRINNLDWMTEQTKQKALKKLDTMQVKIGYPDNWEDYSNLAIESTEQGGSLASNIIKIRKRSLEKRLSMLDKMPDRSEWGLPAHIVNAYYSPSANEIVFPAGILQPPFYNPNGTKEENLGKIGAVIGHEVTHAFDSLGSKFDENGNLSNWWQKEDLEKIQGKGTAGSRYLL